MEDYSFDRMLQDLSNGFGIYCPINSWCMPEVIITGGKKEVTVITCTDDSKQRVVLKCKEVK